MARKLARVVEQEVEEAIEIPAVAERDDDVIAALESELDGLSGSNGAYVNVYRLVQGKPDAYLIRLAPEDFSIESIKQQYGGGVYRIRAYRRNELRQSRIFRNDIINIADAPKEPEKPLAPPPPDVLPALIAALQDGFARLGAIIVEARPRESEEQMLNKMLVYKQLFSSAPTGPTSPPMTEMLGAVKEVLALSNTMREYSGNGEGGGPDGMSVLMKAMDTFGKPLVEGVMAAQQAQAQAQAQAMPPAPGPVLPAPAPQAQHSVQKSEADMMKTVVRMYLGELVNAAAGKGDVNLYADVILDRVPDATLDELVMPADWFERMVRIQPAVAQHREWFTQLRGIVYEVLTSPEDGNIDAATREADVPKADSARTGNGNP